VHQVAHTLCNIINIIKTEIAIYTAETSTLLETIMKDSTIQVKRSKI